MDLRRHPREAPRLRTAAGGAGVHAGLHRDVVGALSAFFLIGIPLLLGGIYLLVRGLTLHPRYRERDVKAGEVPKATPSGGIAALAEAQPKDGA